MCRICWAIQKMQKICYPFFFPELCREQFRVRELWRRCRRWRRRFVRLEIFSGHWSAAGVAELHLPAEAVPDRGDDLSHRLQLP